ncbi:hypothetical protein LCGC14_1717580 [marine sediment metagenome]|uniref:Zinc-ribbon domain-containing protein n=1 Tax=marine sediment metagenome TaxID=412755 RepID=A0A0F9HD49_9ZZZZ
MAKIKLLDSWTTALSINDIEIRLNEFIKEYRIKVLKQQDGQIIGKQGSQFKTRSGSGIWTDPALYPKKINIILSAKEDYFDIDVKLEDSLGFYLKTIGMNKKYSQYFEMMMTNLKDLLPPLEIISLSLNEKHEMGKYCAYCGKLIEKSDQKYCIDCGKKLS